MQLATTKKITNQKGGKTYKFVSILNIYLPTTWKTNILWRSTLYFIPLLSSHSRVTFGGKFFVSYRKMFFDRPFAQKKEISSVNPDSKSWQGLSYLWCKRAEKIKGCSNSILRSTFAKITKGRMSKWIWEFILEMDIFW